MSAYHQMDFAGRYGRLGDESEAKFRELNPNCEDYGLRRPEINLAKVPAFVRYTPDFLQHNRLIEVMGIGRDGTLKLKFEKLEALKQWEMHFPVDLFVWDSHRERHITMPLPQVHKLCLKDGKPDQFHDGKWAWWLNLVQQFTLEWLA